MSNINSNASNNKEITVKCIVERQTDTPEHSDHVITAVIDLPADALFCDVTRIALCKLGLQSHEVSHTRGSIQLRNWRALDFGLITLNSLLTLDHVIGQLKNMVTLKFKLPKIKQTRMSIEVMRSKLLEIMLTNQINLPFDKQLLHRLIRGQDILSDDRCKSFANWTEEHNIRRSPLKMTVPTPVVRPQVRPQLQRWFQSEDEHSSTEHCSMEEKAAEEKSAEYKASLEKCQSRDIVTSPRAMKRLHYNGITQEIKSERKSPSLEAEGHKIVVPLPILPNRNAVYTIHPMMNSAESESPFTKKVRSSDEEDESVSVSRLSRSEHPVNITATPLPLPTTSVKSEHHLKESQSPLTTVDMSTRQFVSQEVMVEDLSMPIKRDTLEPIASSLSSAFYIQHQQRQFHMLQMAQLASLNYLGHGIQAPPPQQTPPPDYVFDQRSLTPSSSSADDKKEDSLSAKKRSRVFIDPLTEIPKLEIWFMDDTHPSSYMIDKYTEELNKSSYRRRFPCLEAKNVQLWFKNHRAKVKRCRHEMMHASASSSSSSSITSSTTSLTSIKTVSSSDTSQEEDGYLRTTREEESDTRTSHEEEGGLRTPYAVTGTPTGRIGQAVAAV